MTIAFILQLPVSFFLSFSVSELTFIPHQVDERLLDVSIPTLLDQTFLIESFNDDDKDNLQQTSISNPGNENENEKVQRILVLEAEIEKSNKVATELLQELSKEKLKRSDLENRIEELELALELEKKKNSMRKKKIHHHHHQQQQHQNDDKTILDIEYCGRMLEIAKKERDDALDLVREIRKLMVKN